MNETIGNRIMRYRKARGLTQEALAEALGVTSQAVSKWENDLSCPDISLLPRLCQVLGVSCDTLLTGSGSQVQYIPEPQRRSLSELTLRIIVTEKDGETTRVNIPAALAVLGGNIAVNFVPKGKQDVDFGQIVSLIKEGVIGKLMDVECPDGDHVEIIVE
ncbi:MAG: helix-turn-helix transcriptional regulator [Eubacteriales bacterium]|nr:helix-turn-helix transcriptional regulator [Eubacteriales bacterium]